MNSESAESVPALQEVAPSVQAPVGCGEKWVETHRSVGWAWVVRNDVPDWVDTKVDSTGRMERSWS